MNMEFDTYWKGRVKGNPTLAVIPIGAEIHPLFGKDGYAPPMSRWTPESQTCSTTCPETGAAVRQPVYIVGMKTRRPEKLTQKRDAGFQICFISFGPVESSWMGKGFQCDPP